MKINLQFPINPTSYGLTGRNLLHEFAKLCEVSCFPIGQVQTDQETINLLNQVHWQARNPSFFDGAPSLRLWHQNALAEGIGRGKRCAFTIFELDRLNPIEEVHCRSNDIVFTSSSFHKRVLEKHGCKAEFVPLGVDRAHFHENIIPANLGIQPETTVFAHVAKAEPRKGILNLRNAFEAAFNKSDNVVLVMLTHNPFIIERDRNGNVTRDGNKEWETFYKSGALGEKVIWLGRQESQAQVAKIMAASDCLVCPAHAEGFNLPLLEALSMGKWAIATDCAAHSDFDRSAFDFGFANLLVDMELEPTTKAVDGTPFFTGQGNWFTFGKDQLDQTVHHMRAIHKEKQYLGSLLRNHRGILFAEQLSWKNSAKKLLEAIS